MDNLLGLVNIYEIDKQIILNLDVKSVLNLYQSSKRFRIICNDQDLYARLLQIHYPRSNISDKVTNTPKQQFMALVNDIKTDYYIHINPNYHEIVTDICNTDRVLERSFIDDVCLANEANVNKLKKRSPLIEFKIIGPRPKNREIFWLKINDNDDSVEAFLTKEDAINSVICAEDYGCVQCKTLNDFIAIVNEYDGAEEWYRDDLIPSALKQHPPELCKQLIFDYIMKASFYHYRTNPHDDIILYRFVKITIDNKYCWV